MAVLPAALRAPTRRLRQLALLILAPLLVACPDTPTEVEDFPEQEVDCTVARVTDGDTFVCSQAGRRVRLLGIDAPESAQWMGPLATDVLRSLLPVGTEVRLVLGAQPTDQFGRTLAWIYRTDDVFVNAQMVQLGYADLFRNSSDRRFEGAFQTYLAEAQGFGRGLWGMGFAACSPWTFKSTGRDCPRL